MCCALQAAMDYQLTAEHRVVVILPDSLRNYMYEYVQYDVSIFTFYIVTKLLRRTLNIFI